MNTTQTLATRELVPMQIDYETVLVPVGESLIAHSNYAGAGVRALLASLGVLPQGRTPSFAGVTDFEHATLVFAGSGTLKNDSAVEAGQASGLRQIPLYYTEVKPFVQISDAHMQQRLRLLHNTGYLLMGPDECIAVLRHCPAVKYTFCDVYENNDEGHVRNLAGYYAESIDFRSKVRSISALDATQTKNALSTARGDLYWWCPKLDVVNKTQLQRIFDTVRLLEDHEKVAPLERRDSGATVKRWFIENGSTESVSSMTKRADGWMRYPTYQDAWYFGVWFNPVKMETMTYAEQDVSHVVCETKEQFQMELADLAEFYGKSRSPSMFAIGAAGTTVCFDSLTLLRGEVETLIFPTEAQPETESEKERVPAAPLIGTLKKDHPSVLSIEDGQQIELGPDAFEIDLLNPVSFTPGNKAVLNKAFGRLQVQLRLAGGCKETAAFVN